MSNEVSNSNTSIGSYALMPSIYVGVNAVNNYRYFKNPIKPLGDATKKFGELTKKVDFDTFQKAQFTSESFEAYRSVAIKAKKFEKLQAGKLPLRTKIVNLFRKNKVTGQDIINKSNDLKNAKANLENIENAKDAKTLQNALKQADEGYANSMNFIRAGKSGQGVVKSFATQTFDNFKKEFSFKKGNRFNAGFNVAMTALQFIPNIAQKVIPAFKNNGFKAGMTELGQTVVQAGADLVAYATGGALGRTIGSAVGALVGPMGAFVGGLVGDMVGSMFVGSKVCGVVEEITNKDDAKNTGNPELAIDSARNIQQQAKEIAMQNNPELFAQQTVQDDSQINFQQANEVKVEVNPNSLNNKQTRHAQYARINAQRNKGTLNSRYV